MGNLIHTVGGNSNLVSFHSAMRAPIASLKINLSAVQSGSGDPSPENIRPISGHDGLTLYRSGADTSNPDVYSVTFPSGAGTVYGGTYDVTTGVLTVTHEAKVFKGRESLSLIGSGTSGYVRRRFGNTGYVISSPGVCSHFPGGVIDSSNTNVGVCIQSVASGSMIAFRWNTGDDTSIPTTVADWKSFFAAQYAAGTPVTVVYELTNPVTYQLSAQQIKTLLGENNIWNNVNGITEVSYVLSDSQMIWNARKRIMGFKKKEYLDIEWLEAKGSQLPYIDMDFYLTDELEAEIHFYNSKEEAFLFGARKNTSNYPFCNFNISRNPQRFRFDYGNRKGNADAFGSMHNGEYLFTFHNRNATVTNLDTQEIITVEYPIKQYKFLVYTDQTLTLFSVRTGDTLTKGSTTDSLRIYSAKFWIGGVLIRDFIPRVRIADGEPGMYDKVTKRFFTKGDANTFTIPT